MTLLLFFLFFRNIPRWDIPWFLPNLFLLGNVPNTGYFLHSYLYIHMFLSL